MLEEEELEGDKNTMFKLESYDEDAYMYESYALGIHSEHGYDNKCVYLEGEKGDVEVISDTCKGIYQDDAMQKGN